MGNDFSKGKKKKKRETEHTEIKQSILKECDFSTCQKRVKIEGPEADNLMKENSSYKNLHGTCII